MEFSFVIALLLLLSQNLLANPLTFEKCALKDSECLVKQAQAALPMFVKGIPELGIQSFDKLHMDIISVDVPDLISELTNVEIGGLSKATIDDISVNMPYKIIRISFNTDLITESDYIVNGTLFGFPIFGEGKGHFSMINLQVEMIIVFDIVKNDQGKDIFEFKSFMYGADAINGLHCQFDNMFNGDKERSDSFHELINKNWRLIVTNYGRYFTPRVLKEVYEAIKIFLTSRPIEDLALY